MLIVTFFYSNQFFVYELSDPNHPPNDCSRMSINGIVASCPCSSDTNTYNIVTGQPMTGNGEFPMKAYRAERSGNIIRGASKIKLTFEFLHHTPFIRITIIIFTLIVIFRVSTAVRGISDRFAFR